MQTEQSETEKAGETGSASYEKKYKELRALLIRSNSIWFSHGSYPYGTDDWSDCSFCRTYRGQGSHNKDCIIPKLLAEVEQEEQAEKQRK